MSVKQTLTTLTQTSNETSFLNTLNENFTIINDALEEAISSQGQTPNYLEADLDLNGHKIYNSGAPTNNNDLARLVDVGNAASYASAASASAIAALNSENAAAGYASTAATQAGLAATAKTNAEAAETLAEEWASKVDGQVDSTDYSSKAYAIGGTGVTSAIGAAKEWAITAEDTEVTTGNYSALHHAAKAAASAAAAIVAKIEWQGAWSAGTYNKNDAVEHNGSSWIATATTTTEEPSISATDWDLLALKGTDGTGAGDVSSDTSTSVDNELVLFKDTSGKLIKRATGSGYVKTTSGVVSNVATIPPNEGGTGVANNAASTLTISGNYATTLTVTGTTGVTLPTSGTLMANPMTTAGDLIYGGTSGTPTRLPKGTSGYFLKQGATNPEWAAVTVGVGSVRAWANFNGTGTPAIRASGNVSSIGDTATGVFTINITSELPDNDYAVSGMCTATGTSTACYAMGIKPTSTEITTGEGSMTTTSVVVTCKATNVFDPDVACVVIIR